MIPSTDLVMTPNVNLARNLQYLSPFELAMSKAITVKGMIRR